MVTGRPSANPVDTAGSSSLKVALYDMDRTEPLMLAIQVERIGQSGGRMRIVDGGGTLLDPNRRS